MLAKSFKQKVDRLLKRGGFKKSTSSKGRIVGLKNVTAGYAFDSSWDEYYVYYECGNFGYERGMAQEDKDNRTVEMFEYLQETDVADFVSLETIRGRVVIQLFHEDVN